MHVTGIEWVGIPGEMPGLVWNPRGIGCSLGCWFCYAPRFGRLQACPDCKSFKPHIHRERLEEPLRRRKNAHVFVCSTADLFDPEAERDWLDEIMAVMAVTPHLTYTVLTKRPWFALAYLTAPGLEARLSDVVAGGLELREAARRNGAGKEVRLPLLNVGFGTSFNDQAGARLRLPKLVQIPAAFRFISYEPALGPVSLAEPHGRAGDTKFVIKQAVGQPMSLYSCWSCQGTGYFETDPYAEYCGDCGGTGIGIDWVIMGRISGNKKAAGKGWVPAEWIDSIVGECAPAGIPVFIKDALAADHLGRPKMQQHTLAVRRCRVCGCTEFNACQTASGPCSWAEWDLCTACKDN